MRSFTSKKLKRKIHEVYNWKVSIGSTTSNATCELPNLTCACYCSVVAVAHQDLEDIRPEDIMLPDTSKGFVTKAYNVVKINAKGKKQKR
jgi:hypothetical protein